MLEQCLRAYPAYIAIYSNEQNYFTPELIRKVSTLRDFSFATGVYSFLNFP